MKGVFPTPNTGSFFPSDTDIQPKTNVGRHRHSELVTRHLTLHFSLTLTVSFPRRRRTLCKISSRRPTLRPPLRALKVAMDTDRKSPIEKEICELVMHRFLSICLSVRLSVWCHLTRTPLDQNSTLENNSYLLMSVWCLMAITNCNS